MRLIFVTEAFGTPHWQCLLCFRCRPPNHQFLRTRPFGRWPILCRGGCRVRHIFSGWRAFDPDAQQPGRRGRCSLYCRDVSQEDTWCYGGRLPVLHHGGHPNRYLRGLCYARSNGLALVPTSHRASDCVGSHADCWNVSVCRILLSTSTRASAEG